MQKRREEKRREKKRRDEKRREVKRRAETRSGVKCKVRKVGQSRNRGNRSLGEGPSKITNFFVAEGL